MKIVSVVLLFILSVRELFAVNTSRLYTTENGLSGNRLICLFQDSKGFIWIGGENGVSKFDGQQFVNYSIGDGLAGNRVYVITEDVNGTIWFGTSNGLSTFQNGRINVIHTKDAEVGKIRSVHASEDGKLWFLSGNPNGYANTTVGYVYNGKVQLIKVPEQLSKVGIYCLFVFKNSVLLGTKKGLYVMENNQVRKVDPAHQAPVFNIIKKTGGGFWLAGLHAGLYTTDLVSVKKVELNPEQVEIIYKIREAASGELLIATGYSVIKVSGSGITDQLQVDKSAVSVFDMLADAEGGIWVATYGGLFRYKNVAFDLISGNPPFSAMSYTAGFYDNATKTYLLGTSNGKIIAEKDNSFRFAEAGASLNFQSTVECIYRDKLNNLWFGGGLGELYCVAPKKQAAKIIDPLLHINPVTAIRMDKESNIWVGTNLRLLKISDKKMTDESVCGTQILKNVHSIEMTEDSLLAVSCESGLFFIVNGKVKIFSDKRLSGIQAKGVYAADGYLFVCTSGLGVLVYRRTGFLTYQYVTAYNKRSGLPSDFTECCYFDKKGFLWVVHENGVSSINLKYKAIRHYYKSDGLVNKPFVKAFFIQDDTGNMRLLLNPTGLYKLNHSVYKRNRRQPPILVSKVVFGEDTIISYDPKSSQTIVIKPGRNTIRADFSAISFDNPEGVRYKYKLKGGDDTYSGPTMNNFITFTNLPAGEYSIIAYACNADGAWSAEPAVVEFVILPPFWKRWWFYFLISITVISIVFLFIKSTLNKQKQQLLLSKKMVDLEMKALRAQMNPHFIFNVLNSIQHCIVSENYDSAQSYLRKFSKMLRMILDNSDYLYNSLQKEIEIIGLYLELEKLRFSDNLIYEIIVDPDVPVHDIFIPTMILQPYVENSIWHGLKEKNGDRKITIRFTKENATLLIQIQDNGIGREKARELRSSVNSSHKSKGLKLTEDRLEIMNLSVKNKAKAIITDLYDVNQKACGTLVSIIIPLNQNG